MVQATNSEKQIIDILRNNGFRVTRERTFGDKWVIDLVGERENTIILVELKSGAPTSHADIFDLVALRKTQQLRNKNIRSFIINTGKFLLNKNAPIMKVAEASGVTIIHGEDLPKVIDKLNSVITG